MTAAATVALEVPGRSACRVDALRLLREKGLHASRVVDVQTDAILWVDQQGKPQTTFVTVARSEFGALRRETETEPGFVA